MGKRISDQLIMTFFVFIFAAPTVQATLEPIADQRVACANLVSSLGAKEVLLVPDRNLTEAQFLRRHPQIDPLFLTNEPIFVGKDGAAQPLTFSLDSEIPYGDIMKLAMTDSQMMIELKNYFLGDDPEARVKFPHPLKFRPRDLATITGHSVNQFPHFALKNGLSRTKRVIELTDLRPSAFEKVLQHIVDHKIITLSRAIEEVTYALGSTLDHQLIRDLSRIVRHSVERRGLPFQVVKDGLDVEFSHKTWRETLFEFFLDQKNLSTLVDYPMTHFHLGIPAEIVSFLQVISVGRGLEAIINLTLALDPHSKRSGRYYNSLLVKNPGTGSGKRGNVLVSDSEWSNPWPSHNLEIRNYSFRESKRGVNKLKGGFHLMALGVRLLQNHDRLKRFKVIEKQNVVDFYTQNLEGALFYLAQVLEDQPDLTKQAMGRKLQYFYMRIQQDQEIKPELRLELAQYLRTHRVLDQLDASVFLSDGPTTP